MGSSKLHSRCLSQVVIPGFALMMGLISGAAPGVAADDEITEFFDSLYGPQSLRVNGTSAKTDDVEFGKQLLEAAKDVEGQPRIVAMLCRLQETYRRHNRS